MPIREFDIIGTNGVQVTDVGLRAQLYSFGFKFHVRVAPENVSRKKVRVVASGDKKSLVSFYDEASAFCRQQLGLPRNNVGRLQEYLGLEPDWSSYASLFGAEQTAKGVGYLEKTYEKLGEIDRKFGAISEKLSYSNKSLDNLAKNMGSMSEINKTLKAINSTLQALEDRLPK